MQVYCIFVLRLPFHLHCILFLVIFKPCFCLVIFFYGKFHYFLCQIERKFVVSVEPPIIIEPRKSSFHNPPLAYWFKAVWLISAYNNFKRIPESLFDFGCHFATISGICQEKL